MMVGGVFPLPPLEGSRQDLPEILLGRGDTTGLEAGSVPENPGLPDAKEGGESPPADVPKPAEQPSSLRAEALKAEGLGPSFLVLMAAYAQMLDQPTNPFTLREGVKGGEGQSAQPEGTSDVSGWAAHQSHVLDSCQPSAVSYQLSAQDSWPQGSVGVTGRSFLLEAGFGEAGPNRDVRPFDVPPGQTGMDTKHPAPQDPWPLGIPSLQGEDPGDGSESKEVHRTEILRFAQGDNLTQEDDTAQGANLSETSSRPWLRAGTKPSATEDASLYAGALLVGARTEEAGQLRATATANGPFALLTAGPSLAQDAPLQVSSFHTGSPAKSEVFAGVDPGSSGTSLEDFAGVEVPASSGDSGSYSKIHPSEHQESFAHTGVGRYPEHGEVSGAAILTEAGVQQGSQPSSAVAQLPFESEMLRPPFAEPAPSGLRAEALKAGGLRPFGLAPSRAKPQDDARGVLTLSEAKGKDQGRRTQDDNFSQVAEEDAPLLAVPRSGSPEGLPLEGIPKSDRPSVFADDEERRGLQSSRNTASPAKSEDFAGVEEAILHQERKAVSEEAVGQRFQMHATRDLPEPPQTVNYAVLRSRGEKAEMLMRLHPHHLGEVEMRIQGKHSEIAAQIFADWPHTVDLIQTSLPHLRRTLEDQGIQVHAFEVGLTDGREGNQGWIAYRESGEGMPSWSGSILSLADESVILSEAKNLAGRKFVQKEGRIDVVV